MSSTEKISPSDNILDAVDDLKAGKMLVVIDSPERENQGDVIFPAETANEEKINFLISKCKGLVCVAVSEAVAQKYELQLMVSPNQNTEANGGQFTVSIDAKKSRDFGISASDRLLTVKTLVDDRTDAADLMKPGHIFPLIARPEGILERQGHTEATVDLCRLAGFKSVGLMCEILDDEGAIADRNQLREFAKENNIRIVYTSELIDHLKKNPLHVEQINKFKKTGFTKLPTKYGEFMISGYQSLIDGREHVFIKHGDISNEPVLTRVHSECITGDTLYSLRCDCGAQLEKSFEEIANNKSGIIVYLSQEGRGIGLMNKLNAYALQDKGLDTVEANESLGFPIDNRNYKVAADILVDQGIKEIVLMTNNPTKVDGLIQNGIKVKNVVSLLTKRQKYNEKYLETKMKKLGHNLHES